eukprot:Phypoly_transcript_23456.p1 GENE.Phypoly_transcript_23456~~Phypoly_transcript_23456.p1  ORF type:complete len:148 (-),score=35.48 Phypoly_transcript_23456:44-487(-)
MEHMSSFYYSFVFFTYVYKPSQVSVHDGYLEIVADCVPTNGRDYASGWIPKTSFPRRTVGTNILFKCLEAETVRKHMKKKTKNKKQKTKNKKQKTKNKKQKTKRKRKKKKEKPKNKKKKEKRKKKNQKTKNKKQKTKNKKPKKNKIK